MGRLFGTDGIRGIANQQLTPELAYRIGQAAALVLRRGQEGKPVVVIGKDTRISSDMLEGAITAGLTACGVNVHTLGVISTPAVALITVRSRAAAGVVISASHNPYAYNGIKFFGPDGSKLPDEMETAIEDLILSEEPLPTCQNGDIGITYDDRHAMDAYIRYLVSTVKGDPHDLRVLVDCANGAASVTAQRVFARYDLDVTYINDKPNGVNINAGCGSTHLDALGKLVAAGSYDVGIAFDGDADRCLAVDENGNEIDGDKIMALIASAMKEAGDLRGDGFVATVMSNMGLHKYAAKHGYRVLCADVGDRNVREMMVKENLVLGGEQSGHIIFSKYATTGDGILTSLKIMEAMIANKAKLSELAAPLKIYPQMLINVRVASKPEAQNDPIVKAKVEEVAEKLGNTGRILVRESGTEPVIRVMVEAEDEAICKEYCMAVVNTIKARGHAVS